MNIYKTTVTIPKPVEEVFQYITTPENFPKWKKDVWIAGKKYGEPGPGFKMVQTVHLMCPRQFMMHVTGYETNRYFKFEARKGFVILPAWEFSFEPGSEGTILRVVCSLNLEEGTVQGILYPMGLSHHWKVFFQLLSRELFSSPSKIRIISFQQAGGDEQVLIQE